MCNTLGNIFRLVIVTATAAAVSNDDNMLWNGDKSLQNNRLTSSLSLAISYRSSPFSFSSCTIANSFSLELKTMRPLVFGSMALMENVPKKNLPWKRRDGSLEAGFQHHGAASFFP